MQAIIIDDSRLARAELRRLLDDQPTIDIVGEASLPAEAINLIEQLRPDLIFLDIQLPGMTGFELLEKLEFIPYVIFTTAYSEHALKAFDYNTLDYLLKPIDKQRLISAIQKGEQLLLPRFNTRRFGPTDRVFVKDGDRCWLVDVADIGLLETVGSYTRLHFNGHKPLIFRTLNYLETRLDPAVFFRANRNQLINLRYVEKVEPWFHYGLVIHLKTGEVIQLSRRKTILFRERMGF